MRGRVRPDVVEAVYAAFGEILEARRTSRLEALIISYCFFRDLESELTPEQQADFRARKEEIEQNAAAIKQANLQ
jgi:hypothetical protein